MKHIFLFLSIAFSTWLFSGCTPSQAPSLASSNITGLDVPDTINIGVARLGTTKDTFVEFRNNSSDTISISSQSLSGSAFQILSTMQISIVPGGSKLVEIGFTPKDTSVEWGSDTVRAQGQSNVIILTGSAITFSSFFRSAPSSIYVTLSGLISRDSGQQSPQTFEFDASANNPEQWHDTLRFQTDYNDGDNAYETDIALGVDTTLRQITWLEASYYDQKGKLSSDEYIYYTSQSIALDRLPLTKDSRGWSSIVTGSNLNSVVSTVQYKQTMYDGLTGNFISQILGIIGYQPSATLSVLIQ